jgi:hypothetical protein
MKSAFIAAVVSAVIASTAATAATIVVTSKNIKNGTIQTVDISAKAKRALRGNRGPRGPRGLAGVQGAQGAQGIQGTPGPQGLSKTTALWAVVGSFGGLAHGSGVEGVSHTQGGVYHVFFVQPVVDCAFVATVESTAAPGTATVQGASGGPNRVSVFTFDPVNLADRGFHLAVFC